MLVLGDGAFQRCLSHESRTFMNGISALIKEALETSLASSTMWAYNKKTSATKQKEGLHENKTLPATWSWTPEVLEINFCFFLWSISVQFSCLVMSDSLWHHGLQQFQASLSITHSWSLFKLMSIESVMPSNHLIFCRPFLLLPSIFASIRVFSDESVLHIRWPKCWNFSFNISPSNEHPGLISFRIDWLDLLTVQGTLKSLFQHHSSKASILQHSAFFIVQLSHPYMTTGKTMALTRWTFVGKVMSLF